MRNYETLYILRPDLEEEATADQVKRLAEVVTTAGGTPGSQYLGQTPHGLRD